MKTRAELKLFERKLDFWNLIEKMESRRSLESWSFRVYLKIKLLEVEYENVNFRNRIWKRLEFWKWFEGSRSFFKKD